MKTTSNKNQISLGRGYGYEILNAVKNAKKSVKIISPYLSASYLDELVSLSKKKVEVTLITSDNLTEQNSNYSFDDSKIIKQEKIINPQAKQKKKNLKIFSMSLLLIGFIILFFSIAFMFLIFISTILIIISIIIAITSYFTKEYNYQYFSIFRVRIFDSHSGDKPWSTSLIHSKIFIIDEKTAYLGSANFTYSGFKTHYETIIKVEDARAIEDISREVENLYNSKELSYKSLDEWGKEIYE